MSRTHIFKTVLLENLRRFPTSVASSGSYKPLKSAHLEVKMVPDPLLYTICIILCLFGNCQGGRGSGGSGGDDGGIN